MKFFKPEDFEGRHHVDAGVSGYVIGDGTAKVCADLANAKLEREGKVVTSQQNRSGDWTSWKTWPNENATHETHKALLIAIEPFELCTHPAEKVKCIGGINSTLPWDKPHQFVNAYYQCECGARVKIPDNINFEEVK